MKNTTVFRDQVYPVIEKYMKTNKRKYDNHVKKFIKERIVELNEVAPYSRIIQNESQKEEFWKDTGLDKKEISNFMCHTYYANMSIKPVAAKDVYTMTLLNIVRYFYMNDMKKDLEMAMIHLSFSGKCYPSVHYNSFRILPYPHIMDYVINNKLSYKYDIKKHGTVLGSIKSLNQTWITTYDAKVRNWDDTDVVYMLDQLLDRMKSFMKNIATEYYKAHKAEEYLAYSSDSLDEDSYRLADSNSLKVGRAVENGMNYITTGKVNFTICKASSSSNVNTNQVKALIELIVSDKNNLPLLRELMTIIVSEFYKDKPTGNINSAEFIVYSIKPRPNTNNKQIKRMKEIQQIFLEQSDEYMRRMKRTATKISYIKALQSYVVYSIHNSNR
jgi:hypothetical protein